MNQAITPALVQALLAEQFPHWAGWPVQAVAHQGWDNRSFRIGDTLCARLPSARAYEAQVHVEHRWLPHLQAHLPWALPESVAVGRPGCGYPWAWSVRRWIDGDTAGRAPPPDPVAFATDLGAFLRALQAVPAHGGPPPGDHNFHRGGSLAVYDPQCRQALAALRGRIDTAAAEAVWSAALATAWPHPPVWVHGDVAAGNLLLRDGRLAAVIDFGQVCIGDPACDLVMAWTGFRGPARHAFRQAVGLDDATWQRGRAWALWKACIVAAGLVQSNAVEACTPRAVIDEILAD